MGERQAADAGEGTDDAEDGRAARHWREVGEDSPRVQGWKGVDCLWNKRALKQQFQYRLPVLAVVDVLILDAVIGPRVLAKQDALLAHRHALDMM